MKVTKILHGELSRKKRDEMMQQGSRATGKDNVIHIKKENKDVSGCTKNKHRRVGATAGEAQRKKIAVEFVKPSPRGLFQTVEGFI
jgi:hypothetical protein